MGAHVVFDKVLGIREWSDTGPQHSRSDLINEVAHRLDIHGVVLGSNKELLHRTFDVDQRVLQGAGMLWAEASVAHAWAHPRAYVDDTAAQSEDVVAVSGNGAVQVGEAGTRTGTRELDVADPGHISCHRKHRTCTRTLFIHHHLKPQMPDEFEVVDVDRV